jgi:hypothetical protein
MPSVDKYVAEATSSEYIIVPDWKLRPVPSSWDEFKEGVNAWLEVTWGPDWQCPYCGNRFWAVLDPILLEAATAWPGQDGPNQGAYPAAPVVCARCWQVTPVLLGQIFERRGPEETAAEN